VESEQAIKKLLFLYAELIDSGDLEGAAALFRHAKLRVLGQEELINSEELLALWRRVVRLYPCGTPRTRHVVTNVILDMDDRVGRAQVRSYYTVYQATENFPLQLIAAGRYRDEFEHIDGDWRFCFRDYSLLDMVGDLSAHLVDMPDTRPG
jgi:3-phenylpropionate/cinnamic acid dioxygenase small subunit